MSFRYHFIISILLLPFISFSQTNFGKPDSKTQGLLLQHGAGFLPVAWQNQIDQVSGLALAFNRFHLSRMAVTRESWQNILRDPANDWIALSGPETVKNYRVAQKRLKDKVLQSLTG
jgi:hypothetical protein